MVDEYYTLETATSGSGTRLADSYLRFYTISNSPLKATRTLSDTSTTSTSCNLSPKDLIGFTASVEYTTDMTNWSSLPDSSNLFDCAFNNTHTLSLGTNAGTITVSGDITNNNGVVTLNHSSTYYVSLSTSNIANSYTVSAKKWNSESDFTNLSLWAQSHDVRSPVVPNGGTSINNLVANVSFTSVSGNMVQQPNVTISIGQTDASGNNFVEWFKFVTSNDNATSNLLVYYAPRPVFKIRRTYGDASTTREIYYKMAESTTYLKVENGIRLSFKNSIGQKALARYKLRGDRVWALAYTGYNGTFFRADGQPSEVTTLSGLTIGDANSITMTLTYYRGNSIRHNSQADGQTSISNMVQSSAISPNFEFGLNRLPVYEYGTTRAYYERFTWNRTASDIKLQVNNNGDLYKSNATHLFNGSNHTVNNLTFVNTSPPVSRNLGAIGLKFIGLYSRYAGQEPTKTFKLTVTGATYNWSVKNPNREDQYVTFNRDANGDIDTTTSTLKSQTLINNLPGNALTKTSSGTKYATDYMLFDFLSNDFVAGKVKITTPESYAFKYTLPPLLLYYSPSYTGNPATFSDFNIEYFQSIPHNVLQSSTKCHIEVPAFYRNSTGNFYGGEKSSGKKSIYVINRANVNIMDHTGYFVLPRPQFKIQAISTYNVTSLPYNLSTVTKSIKYQDIESAMDEQSWASDSRLERGYGVYAAYYTYDYESNQVVYYKKNSYFKMPFTSNDGINQSTLYTGANYIRLKLYPNSNIGKCTVSSNNIKINLLQGYNNGEAYSYIPGDHYYNGTYDNNITTVYNGSISGLLTGTSYTDTSTSTNKTTYFQGYYSGNGKYGIRFSQDSSIFSTDITTIPGGLGNSNYNIAIDGIMPFMSLDSTRYFLNNNSKTINAFQTRHLDLLPGDTTKLILYGHTYDYDTTNNRLVANIIKYETATGIDFSSISGNNILMKNLVFKAGKKSTAKVVIRENTNVLSDIPFNLVKDTATAVNNLTQTNWDNLTWNTETFSTAVDLAFTVTSLSKKGQGILTDILGTSIFSPYRCLVSLYPPRVELRSADGSPLYQVNAFGTLFNVRTHTSMVELIDSSMLGSTNAPFEYIAYNALKGNAL